MSEIQKDSDIVDKRKNKLKVESSLREKIDRKLFNTLEDMEIGQKVCGMWSAASADSSEWLGKQTDYLADYDDFLEIEPQGVFESSSNLKVPMTLWVLKTVHARFLQTLLTPEPSLSAKARKREYAEVEQDIEDFIKYTLVEWCNNYQGIEETLDQLVWSWLSTGVAYVKNRWHKKYVRYSDVVTKKVPGPAKFEYDPTIEAEVERPTVIDEETETFKTEMVFNGPMVDFVKPEDIAVVSSDITNIDGADAVIHREFLNASDLWTLADLGIFDEDAVSEVIEGGESSKSGAEGGNLKQARQENSGEASLDKTYDLDTYEILETYLSVDVDGSGINSEVIVWVSTKTKKPLRATYLHKVYKNGRRPFSVAVFHKRSGTNDHKPVGLVEMLHCIQKELDAIHNMRIDFGMVSTMPFGFYRASSSINPKQIQLEPGALIPVDNPSDVYFPNLGNRTIFGLQEEQQLYIMVERLTGISDLSLGAMSGRQGATRTASGVRAMLSESNTNLDVPLKRLNRCWKRVLENLLDMLQQRTPAGFQYRVPGGDGFDRYMKITGPHDLAGDYGIEVSPETSASNPQVRLENATQVLQITQNPLYIQMGIVSPQNMYEAAVNFLKTIGVKEVSKFLNSGFANQYILTPQEEYDRVIGLNPPPIMPNSDHEGFIALVQEVMANDAKISQLNREQVVALQLQMSKHSQMMAAIEQQAARQANLTQQTANSQAAIASPASAPAAPVMPMTQGSGNEQ